MIANIFDNVPVNIKDEQIQALTNSDKVRIERIVSNGQTSPKNFWYDQDENEFVMLLEGSAILEVKTGEYVEEVKLGIGDYLLISANQKHRVTYTDTESPTVWLAVFY